jgi:hypothetical protein
MRTKMRSLHGDKVRLVPVSMGGGGLLSKLRPSPASNVLGGGGLLPGLNLNGVGDDLLSTLEARALWARFGL